MWRALRKYDRFPHLKKCFQFPEDESEMPNVTNGFECVLFFVIFAVESRFRYSDFSSNKLHCLMIIFWKCPSPRFYENTPKKWCILTFFLPKGLDGRVPPIFWPFKKTSTKRKWFRWKQLFYSHSTDIVWGRGGGGEGLGCVVW